MVGTQCSSTLTLFHDILYILLGGNCLIFHFPQNCHIFHGCDVKIKNLQRQITVLIQLARYMYLSEQNQTFQCYLISAVYNSDKLENSRRVDPRC